MKTTDVLRLAWEALHSTMRGNWNGNQLNAACSAIDAALAKATGEQA
jgi:hypothetical protein